MDALYDPLFGEPEVAACLSEGMRLQAMLDVEAALAESEAALGLIPAAAAAPIRAAARATLYDQRAIAAEAARDGNLAIPLVRHLTRQVALSDAAAARFVHWGATSQDIIDTALILQLDAALPLIGHHVERAMTAAATLAARHIDTVMPGRTWLQQATPTTFGLKAAGWLDALQRSRERLESAWAEARVLQLGGASGTLAAFGAGASPSGANGANGVNRGLALVKPGTQASDQGASRAPADSSRASGGDVGLALATHLASRLGLLAPDLPWHAHRDRLAHVAATLGIAVGTLGKIGRDVALLAQTEVAEAREVPPAVGASGAADAAGAATGGGSSTMPHKQNPVGAAVAIAAAVRAPGLVSTILAAMPQEHERGLGGWLAEWPTLPELVLVCAGAARAIADVLTSLVVDPGRMRVNLDATHGLVLAEAVTLALARDLGKQPAHAIVEEACRRALTTSRPLAEILAADARVARHLDRAALDRLLSPDNYLGSARAMVERVLARGDDREP